MPFSNTFTRYIAAQYLIWFVSVFAVLGFVVALFDLVEMTRRASGKDEAGFDVVLSMVGFKLPYLLQDMMPFVILFATMFALWRLSRSNELVIARAAGVSVWQMLSPIIVIAVLIGATQVAFLNPFAAAMNAKYEALSSYYLKRQASQLALSPTGFWLREPSLGFVDVIHARRVSQEGMELSDVMVLRLNEREQFMERIDAEQAILHDGQWRLTNANISDLEGRTRRVAEIHLPSNMTNQKIKDSFASADTIPFWELPGFIDTLHAAGFSAAEHRLQFHRLLSTPLLLAAMVLVAAAFALRVQNRTGTGLMVLGGVASGFAFFFAARLIHALGLSTTLPVHLAAWIPAGVTCMLGVAALLHFEDG